MKIKYEITTTSFGHRINYKLVDVVTLDCFKDLMKISEKYNRSTKEGHILFYREDTALFEEVKRWMNVINLDINSYNYPEKKEKKEKNKQGNKSLQQRIEDADIPEFISGRWVDLETGLEI